MINVILLDLINPVKHDICRQTQIPNLAMGIGCFL